MANIVNSDIIEVAAYFKAGAQSAVMVWHYKAEDQVGSGGEDTELLEDLSNWFSPLLKPLLSEQAVFQGMSLQKISPLRADKIFDTTDAGPGTAVGHLLSTQTAGVISLRTGVASRSKRGRKYMPFPSESSNSVSGAPEAQYRTDLGALGAAFLQSFTDEGAMDNIWIRPVIFSRITGTTQRITSYVVRANWGTQRRRSQLNAGDAFTL